MVINDQYMTWNRHTLWKHLLTNDMTSHKPTIDQGTQWLAPSTEGVCVGGGGGMQGDTVTPLLHTTPLESSTVVHLFLSSLQSCVPASN